MFMGTGIGFICEICGYKVSARWGNGFLYPTVYQETVKDMTSGKHGFIAKVFFEEHPDGAINAELTLARCDNCGYYDNVKDLTMYVPKKGYVKTEDPESIWSSAAPFKGADYVSPTDLEKNYIPYQKYPHKCNCCGGDLNIIPLYTYQPDPNGRGADELSAQLESELQEIISPVCKGKMIPLEFIDWD